ncbi:MAG: COX15/CtaA family protein [Terricaulis sp.]
MSTASAVTRYEPPRDLWVGVWLLAITVLVFAMILVGGATRLTDSGLSITEWNLEKGLIPPFSAERWAEEFALYQHTTEYQMQNQGMSLAEFQAIYWWEWGHRFLGKMIGLAFATPFAFFWATGRLRGRFWPVLALFALGGAQGAIGWWMVTSGLFSGLDVSPVRLAIHLGMALALLAGALWLAMDALGWPRDRADIGVSARAAWAFVALLFAQIMFGALLAGADGGPAYSDWPTIGRELIPAHAFSLEPLWRNFTEHHATQHLLHRTLGYCIALAAFALAWFGMRRGNGIGRRLALALGALALIQALLGVAAIVTGAHLALSLAHQACAALLWTLATQAARVAGNAIPQR